MYRLCTTLLVFLACATANGQLAQNVEKVSSPAASTSSERKVTIDLKDVTIKAALEEIARQSGSLIAIGDDALTSSSRVRMRITNASPREAVLQVIKGKGLQVQTGPGGQLLITRQSNSKPGAQGVIAGKVTESKSGKGIPGVNIFVDGDAQRTVSTDDGSYRLAGVAAGNRIVSVRALGYAKQSRRIIVGEGATVTADFKMEPSANVLDQVVVTGTVVATELKAVPNAITVITAKQIEERGITRIDQLFRGDIPGLFAQNNGSYEPFAVTMYSRGPTAFDPGTQATGYMNTNPIKTYVDGVELADSKYLSQIDPKSIERIEILTGPQASTIYGSNAINGVMQVFTKRGTNARPQIALSLLSGLIQNNYSSALTPQHDHSAQVNGVEGSIAYNVGGSWFYVGPWTPAIQTTRMSGFGGVKFNKGPLTADLSVRHNTTENRSRGSGVQRTIDYYQTGWYAVGTVGQAHPSPSNTTVNGETWGTTIAYAPASWWSNELVYGTDRARSETHYTTPGYSSTLDTALYLSQSTNERKSIRYSTTAQIPLPYQTNLSITGGIDGWRSLSNSFSGSPTSLTGSLTTTSWSMNRQPGHNTGGFLQSQLGLRDKLFLTYGLRAEWNPTYGDEAQPNLAPRYGVAYTHDIPTSRGSLTAKLRGSYGRSTRPPAVGQKRAIPALKFGANYVTLYGPFDYYLPSPDLGPESQQGGEGGLELYFGSRASVVVTRYNQTVNNLISALYTDSVQSLVPVPSGTSSFLYDHLDENGYGWKSQLQYINLGNIRNQGWELQSSVNTGPFTTRGTYSWTKSRVIGVSEKYRSQLTDQSYQRGSMFTYMPEHTWALGVTYGHYNTTVALNLTGNGMMYRTSDEIFYNLISTSIRLTPNRARVSDVRRKFPAKGYAMGDLNATHRFSERMEGVFQVRNLADYYRNDYSAQYVTMGRETKAGLRLRF